MTTIDYFSLGPRCLQQADRLPIGPPTQRPLTIEDLIIPESINANIVVPDGVPLPPNIQSFLDNKPDNFNLICTTRGQLYRFVD